ncbi:Methylcrotonoyl-CoA carboxylase subunit alpha, mitochondrial [Sphaceloma murrayae]|uniref:Methylcrotonoyl-CoA carboxylase subunit alpha, mitochondrial n=1 Tax=Sphaceloma murrayae TaxID=2082308 RepID=A0A2K1QVP8_9PEZI|nr:Methylcrotonoyl-CoA carboxylase subunit alpha, mitochondrial [Sphaceloma murrayae]
MLTRGSRVVALPGLRVGGRRWKSTTPTSSVPQTPLQSILIANRGEIALRVGRTASESGIKTTVLYTDPDARAQHALSSPYAINLGDASRYLDGDYIIEVAKKHHCQGIHPGYGFLSENAGFAKKCTEAGLNFIGPPWKAVDAMGDKSRSKEIMTAAGVPCIPGYHGSNQDPAFLAREADKIGYPVLLKAVKGGGGKGMRIAMTPDEFAGQLESAKSEARSSFGDDVMLVEKYIITPRHIEVQVFADKHGNAVALGERDCSIQRRHQKILEESPAPNLDEAIRQDLWAKARDAALAVNYEGAGTVEFIFDNDTGKFFFMEMNTRLQVEHPVTEMVTGQDLVDWQIRIASGQKISMTQEEIHEEIKKRGHAIEARIYAENPDMNFVPDSGMLLHLQTPTPTSTVRIDAGFAAGDQVSSYYDPMIAKLIVQGPDRATALQKMYAALAQYEIAGPMSNIEFLKRMCVSPGFVKGDVETGYIAKNSEELFRRQTIEPELWMQAAIGLYLAEQPGQSSNTLATTIPTIGFGTGLPARQFDLVELPADGKSDPAKATVKVTQIAPGVLQVAKDGSEPIVITSKYTPTNRTIQSFFPHTRLDTRFIKDPETNVLILFNQGSSVRLQLATPKWSDKVLGTKDVKNSVLAPMPCKVLRVEVTEGVAVKKNQPLVVIESMKMETVIRAPHDGVIAKVVHKAGDLCKAGTALVEFAESVDS